MAAITPKQAQDFSYMPYGAKEEAEKKSKTLNLGIHLQYALEQQGVWHGTLDKAFRQLKIGDCCNRAAFCNRRSIN
jgi:hypothetical protein